MNKLLEYAFLGNRWSWFHCLAGCVLYIAWRLSFHTLPRSSGIYFVLGCALVWEAFEFVSETPNKAKAIEV